MSSYGGACRNSTARRSPDTAKAAALLEQSGPLIVAKGTGARGELVKNFLGQIVRGNASSGSQRVVSTCQDARRTAATATSAWERTRRTAGVACRLVGGTGPHETTVPTTPLAKASGTGRTTTGRFVISGCWSNLRSTCSIPRHISSTTRRDQRRAVLARGRTISPTGRTATIGEMASRAPTLMAALKGLALRV